MAETIWRHALPLLAREADGRAFRLIGIGVTDLCDPVRADPPDLFDAAHARTLATGRLVDDLRDRFGRTVISRRSFGVDGDGNK